METTAVSDDVMTLDEISPAATALEPFGPAADAARPPARLWQEADVEGPVDPDPEATLNELAELIKNAVLGERHWCFKLLKLGIQQIERARRIGALLAAAKAKVGHGGWERWVHEKCTIEPRMARNYITIFERWAEVEPWLDPDRQPVAGLTVKKVLKMLSMSREPAALPAPEGGVADGGGADEAAAADDAAAGPEPEPEPEPGDPTADLPTPAAADATAPEGPTAPRLAWPGLDDPAAAAALDEVRARVQPALQLIREFDTGAVGDLRRMRALWAASRPYLEQVAELLTARSPRAIVRCEACHGEGVVKGRPCGRCAGTGMTLGGNGVSASRPRPRTRASVGQGGARRRPGGGRRPNPSRGSEPPRAITHFLPGFGE
jgi:hypothetical protein